MELPYPTLGRQKTSWHYIFQLHVFVGQLHIYNMLVSMLKKSTREELFWNQL